MLCNIFMIDISLTNVWLTEQMCIPHHPFEFFFHVLKFHIFSWEHFLKRHLTKHLCYFTGEFLQKLSHICAYIYEFIVIKLSHMLAMLRLYHKSEHYMIKLQSCKKDANLQKTTHPQILTKAFSIGSICTSVMPAIVLALCDQTSKSFGEH